MLDAFIARADDYGRLRNFDFGPHNRRNISCLSPYLKHRLITEQEVCKLVLASHPLERVDKFIQEVCWRTYWKGWLQMRPSVWRDYKVELENLIDQLNHDADLCAQYMRALNGETGIDCFDAWVQELKDYGYLHNHARMWFASIWIFTLKLPWVLGADFFLRHLLDGDAASNTLSWRWVAGLQTLGKNYVASADNIEKFTDGRFHPKGLAINATPLSSLTVLMPPDDPFKAFDACTHHINTDKTLYIIHEDDCGFRPPDTANHFVVLDASQHVSPLNIASQRADFTRQALGEGHLVENVHQIIDYALAHNLAHMTMSRPCAGPVMDALAELPLKAEANGLSVDVHTHEWDRTAWPKATKGFFPFRKAIPELIALDLPRV